MKLTVAICLFSLISLVISAPDPNFWIFLAFGQNNMAGTGKYTDEDRECDERFKMMPATDMPNSGRSKFQWYTAYPPLCFDGSQLSLTSYFGRTLVEKLPEKIKIGIITVALTGLRIDIYDEDRREWFLSTVTADFLTWAIYSTYNNDPFRALIYAAKEAQYDGVIKGILMHQGEANIGDEEWPVKVKKVYGDILRELNLKEEETPFLVGEVVRSEYGSRFGVVNEMIDKIPEYINNSYVISSEGLPPISQYDFQFSAESQRELGKRYAEKMLELLPKFEQEKISQNLNQDVGSNTGLIIGIAIAITLLAAGAVGGFLFYKKKLAKSSAGANESTPLFSN